MKSLLKLAVRLVALLLPFPLAVMVAMSAFPMDFFDDEYGWYAQHQACAMGPGGDYRVLVMGDSSAKATFRPELLSEDTLNYAIDGATAIENYYYLREYLAHHEAPACLIYMQCPWYLLTDQFFWSRSVFFHRISEDDLRDLAETLRTMHDLSPLQVATVEEFKREVALYRYYAPQKYSMVFLKGLALNLIGQGRGKSNEASYATAAANRGQRRHGDGTDGDQPVVILSEHFVPGDLMEHYFRALMELCAEHHIQFIFQSSPMNEHSRSGIHDTWIADYMDYLEGFQSEYPGVIMNGTLEWYGAEYFSDPFHLNERGVAVYCAMLRERYASVFEP